MRRPRFNRWIRSEVLRLAKTSSFNLRKLAAKAQRKPQSELARALLLDAHENGQIERLMSYVYNADLAQEYRSIEQRLGARSIERLALRGTPMMSMPEPYRDFLMRYEASYHAPEIIAAEKQELLERSKNAVLRTGITTTEIARALKLDVGNLHAYLMRGEVGRFTLDTARTIDSYLEKQLH